MASGPHELDSQILAHEIGVKLMNDLGMPTYVSLTFFRVALLGFLAEDRHSVSRSKLCVLEDER